MRGAANFHLSHGCAIDTPSLAITPGADDVWASYQSISDTTAPVVEPQLVLQALDRAVADTTAADITGLLAGFLEDINTSTGDQKLFFMLT